MQPIFYFDFGSPNAYLAYRVLPEFEARNGVTFTPVPVLLGGIFRLANNRPPLVAFGEIPAKVAYVRLEIARFIRRHKLTNFAFNPHFPVNTLAMMRGAVAAEAEGLLAPYMEAMFVGMWERRLNLAEPEMIAGVLGEVGLPADTILARAQEQDIKIRLVANTQAAFDKGVFGIPSFLVGDELFFGKDTLPDIALELAEQRAAAAS